MSRRWFQFQVAIIILHALSMLSTGACLVMSKDIGTTLAVGFAFICFVWCLSVEIRKYLDWKNVA